MTGNEKVRVVAACPWCGSGTPLKVAGDGFGRLSLSCLKCRCRGPEVPIAGDFDQADESAIAGWSTRSSVPSESIHRVTAAVNLAALMQGGTLRPETEVPVRFDDLLRLIRICQPAWDRRGESVNESENAKADGCVQVGAAGSSSVPSAAH